MPPTTDPITNDTWFRPINATPNAAGSIHNDRVATALGYPSAVIGAGVHLACLTRAFVERWGPAWYERGFIKLAFPKPVYEGDEWRLVIRDLEPAPSDEAFVEFTLELRDGTIASPGYAGIARSAEAAVPPWERADEPPLLAPPASEDDPLSSLPVGFVFPPDERTVTIEQTARRRAQAEEFSPWYTEQSPWGRPIVPMYQYILLEAGAKTLRKALPGVEGQMNGTFQLLMCGPMFAGEPHTLRSTLIEKGRGPRAAVRTIEFTIEDATGRRIAIARQKIRWLEDALDAAEVPRDRTAGA